MRYKHKSLDLKVELFKLIKLFYFLTKDKGLHSAQNNFLAFYIMTS